MLILEEVEEEEEEVVVVIIIGLTLVILLLKDFLAEMIMKIGMMIIKNNSTHIITIEFQHLTRN